MLKSHLPGLLRSGLLLVWICCAGCGSDVPTVPPNVLFISLDSVRADDLTFMDAERAPRMTELAQRGTVFTRASSGSSWTLPAHAQMFTGQPPSLHGVQADHHRIDPLTKTLPECLDEIGYDSAGFWSGWYLAGTFGYARGFGTYETAMAIDPAETRAWKEALKGDRASAERATIKREHSSHREITSERIVEQARAALAGSNPDTPFFLFAHFFDPHYDFIPPAPYDTRFDPDYEGAMTGDNFWANKGIIDRSQRPPKRTISERDLKHIRALYRGEIAWTDAAVGQLIDLFEASGRLENTLIIIVSDHGEEFFEHQNIGHRQSLYEEVLRVPLLVVPPAGRKPKPIAQSDALVSLSDLMPTVLEYVGTGAFPTSIHGRSVKPLVEGRSLGERALISSLAMVQGDTTLVIEAMTTDEAKLTRHLSLSADGTVRLQGAFWSDLLGDPLELRPRGKRTNPLLRAAWERMEVETAALRQFHELQPHSDPASRRTKVTEIFADELADLGYGGAEPVPELAEGGKEWTLAPLPAIAIDGQ